MKSLRHSYIIRKLSNPYYKIKYLDNAINCFVYPLGKKYDFFLGYNIFDPVYSEEELEKLRQFLDQSNIKFKHFFSFTGITFDKLRNISNIYSSHVLSGDSLIIPVQDINKLTKVIKLLKLKGYKDYDILINSKKNNIKFFFENQSFMNLIKYVKYYQISQHKEKLIRYALIHADRKYDWND